MRRPTARILTVVVFVGLAVVAQDPISKSVSRSIASVEKFSFTFPVKTLPPKPYQIGIASWYGQEFEGKPTASGEPYNMYDLTAAHPSLPLGTLVRVTNLRNRRAVVVRINDRGPIVPGRIIDVSYGVAKILRFEVQGLEQVRLDVVSARTLPTTMALLQPPILSRLAA